MLDVIKSILQQLINDIDAGNSNINENQQQEVLNILETITKKELTKSEAADYIGRCPATFDNYVKKGLIPKGRKRQGLSNYFWNKKDLDDYVKNIQQ